MKNKLERSLSNNHRERNEMMMMRSVVTSRRVMVRSIHGVPFENSGVTSPSLLYLISIIFYSCNIIIVIAAIPRDHRRLLPRQFEERSLGMKKKNDGTNNMFKMGWREWDDAKFTRVFLAWTAACRGRRSWRVIEREQRRKWKWRKEKKKSEIIYIYYCIESCALRLRFKLVRL